MVNTVFDTTLVYTINNTNFQQFLYTFLYNQLKHVGLKAKNSTSIFSNKEVNSVVICLLGFVSDCVAFKSLKFTDAHTR